MTLTTVDKSEYLPGFLYLVKNRVQIIPRIRRKTLKNTAGL
jgi:hypothetical protein